MIENLSTGEFSSPGWHAVCTRHQHERVATRNLAQKDFEVFLPLCLVTHRWKDRMKKLFLPLFPCYVFVRIKDERRIELLNTPGVKSLVAFAGRPAVIPQVEIEAVRRAVESKTPIAPVPYLRSGSRVRVTRGSLEGIEGVLVRARDGADRLILSVELLQRSVAVEVDTSMVEPILSPSGQRSNLPIPSLIAECA
jgi:transcription antitermination factor NusG